MGGPGSGRKKGSTNKSNSLSIAKKKQAKAWAEHQKKHPEPKGITGLGNYWSKK
jgi:hypothetical protein